MLVPTAPNRKTRVGFAELLPVILMRDWWNAYTSGLDPDARKGLGVRVPHRAPRIHHPMVRVSAFQAEDAGPIPAGCSILMFPWVIGSPAPSEGALSPFESEGNNLLSVSLVERLKAEVCKTSRANCPHGGSNPSRHSKGDVAQRLVRSLHKAFVGGPNPPISTKK